jgi:hypothetical protein
MDQSAYHMMLCLTRQKPQADISGRHQAAIENGTTSNVYWLARVDDRTCGTARSVTAPQGTRCSRSLYEAGKAMIPRIWVYGKWDSIRGKICHQRRSCSSSDDKPHIGVSRSAHGAVWAQRPPLNTMTRCSARSMRPGVCTQHTRASQAMSKGTGYRTVSAMPAAWGSIGCDR